jgi:hypothetical protein
MRLLTVSCWLSVTRSKRTGVSAPHEKLRPRKETIHFSKILGAVDKCVAGRSMSSRKWVTGEGEHWPQSSGPWRDV